MGNAVKGGWTGGGSARAAASRNAERYATEKLRTAEREALMSCLQRDSAGSAADGDRQVTRR